MNKECDHIWGLGFPLDICQKCGISSKGVKSPQPAAGEASNTTELLKRKLFLATEALEKMAEAVPLSHGMGLVTYGHKTKLLADETLQKMEAL